MADESVIIDKFTEEILSFFPRIYYPFRRLLGEYSEFQITTLQILELHGDWFLRKQLYEELKLSSQIISKKIIPPLVKNNLVESTRDVPPSPNKRVAVDRITPRGKKFLEKVTRSRKEFIKGLLKLTTKENREIIIFLLRKANELASSPEISAMLNRALTKIE